MKHTLTPAQIVLLPSALCEALASYESHLEELNGHAPASAAYWRAEAAKVRALKALLDDAIQIEVTTATSTKEAVASELAEIRTTESELTGRLVRQASKILSDSIPEQPPAQGDDSNLWDGGVTATPSAEQPQPPAPQNLPPTPASDADTTRRPSLAKMLLFGLTPRGRQHCPRFYARPRPLFAPRPGSCAETIRSFALNAASALCWPILRTLARRLPAAAQAQGPATPATPLSETALAAHLSGSIPTTPASPTPRAQRLASTLSKPTLRRLLGFPQPLPDYILASLCNTIVRSRGETAPLDARDLQAAARLLWQQRGYKPHLPQPCQAPEECPKSREETRAAPAHSSAPVPHPKTAAVPSRSSPDSAPGR